MEWDKPGKPEDSRFRRYRAEETYRNNKENGCFNAYYEKNHKIVMCDGCGCLVHHKNLSKHKRTKKCKMMTQAIFFKRIAVSRCNSKNSIAYLELTFWRVILGIGEIYYDLERGYGSIQNLKKLIKILNYAKEWVKKQPYKQSRNFCESCFG